MKRWPGQTPYVSYGDNQTIKIEGKVISIRKDHPLLKFRSLGVNRIFGNKELAPVPTQQRRQRRKTPSDYLQYLDVDSIPSQLLDEYNNESAALTADNIFNPAEAQKVIYKDDIDSIIWANSSHLHFISDTEVLQTIDVGSPILQVESLDEPETLLLRTYKGLSTLRASTLDDLYNGDTMHSAVRGTDSALCLPNGSVRIWDHSAEATKYEQKFPRVNTYGYSKTAWASDNSLFHIDEHHVRLIDIRASKDHLIRDSMTQHHMAVRDIVASNENLFVLESSSLFWYDARMPKYPVMEVPHFGSRGDPSWRLSLLEPDHLLMSSLSTPFNIAIAFGTVKGFPVNTAEPYMIDLPPNVSVQSQISVPRGKGLVNLYVSTPRGGLYRQKLASGRSECELPEDNVLSLEPDTPVAEKTLIPKDFQFTKPFENSTSIDLSACVDHGENVMAALFTPNHKKSKEDESVVPFFGIADVYTKKELSVHHQDLWLKSVSDQAQQYRTKHIKRIERDLLGTKICIPKLELPKSVNATTLKQFTDWSDPSDPSVKEEVLTDALTDVQSKSTETIQRFPNDLETDIESSPISEQGSGRRIRRPSSSARESSQRRVNFSETVTQVPSSQASFSSSQSNKNKRKKKKRDGFG